MPRPKGPGLNPVRRKRADGTATFDWYHRPTGRLIGRERDGMPRERALAIAAEMDEDMRAPSGPPSGSFGELCALYLASPKFKRRAPRTQQEYRDHIEILRSAWEGVPVAGITRKAVAVLHAGYAATPWRGNAILRTLRLVLNFGIHDLELPGLVRNPAAHFDLHETSPRSQVWDQARIDAFLDAATAVAPRMRKALALLLYTAQRPGDVLTMARPMMWQDGEGRTWIRLRQAKTGEAVDVPCHARLGAELAAPEPPAKPGAQPSTLLLPSPRGLPWRMRNFARMWDRVVARANLRLARQALRARGGLPLARVEEAREAAKAAVRAALISDLQRRDLRRTGVVQLALAGATIPQIAALTGWKIDHAQRIVETYLPRRGEVALGGVERWEAAPAPKVVPLAGRKRR
ncbi:site-specific integrase [Paracraurococcus ruber]|uniref:Integrase n=1 Tax=Paracraurococcus ruber TaxID=77675 RepID=A0ABS1CR08_9PROT|nr:integrase [Paracraurococcus ruber]MBK1656877.1 integrase [Paracraurococcus ruber]TDG33990.1 integrase [Paracraurococcus ruber]